jgi:branched-chain amino acid transport system permease protein
MGRRILLLTGVIVTALLAPQFLDVFWINTLIQIMCLGLLALSVDLLLGHTGLWPFGHAAFFAIAAYMVAILQVKLGQPTIVAVPAGVGAAMILALVYGLAVRTSGVYFLLVTLALGHIVWGVSMRWVSLSGGDNGIGNIPYPKLGSFVIMGAQSYYYVVLAVVLLCLFGYWILVRSPFGLALRGIRESKSRMRALGYNVVMHKYIAFVLSGTLAGIAGVLYIYYNRLVSPVTASLHISVEAALMVLIGGTGTIFGPFIGAAIILVLRNYVSGHFVYWMTLMGLVFIATVLWAPDGLLGIVRRIRDKKGAGDAMQEPDGRETGDRKGKNS